MALRGLVVEQYQFDIIVGGMILELDHPPHKITKKYFSSFDPKTSWINLIFWETLF